MRADRELAAARGLTPMLMLMKFAIALVVGIAVLVAVKDGRVIAAAGLTGSCHAASAAAGDAFWYSCDSGLLERRPDLSRHQCVAQGVRGDVQLWRCPAELASGIGSIR